MSSGNIPDGNMVFSNGDLEEVADQVKILILTALVREGYLNVARADFFAETHTVISRKKGIFRTLSDRFFKSPCQTSRAQLIVVKTLDHEPVVNNGKVLKIVKDSDD